MHGTDRTERPDLHNPATGGTSYQAILEAIAEREADLIAEDDGWLEEDNDNGRTLLHVEFDVVCPDPGTAALLNEVVQDSIDAEWATDQATARSLTLNDIQNLSARVV
jgi:hypothetical protein